MESSVLAQWRCNRITRCIFCVHCTDGLSTSMPVGHKAVEGTTVDGHIHNVTNYYLHTHFVFEILHTGKNVRFMTI